MRNAGYLRLVRGTRVSEVDAWLEQAAKYRFGPQYTGLTLLPCQFELSAVRN